MFSFFLKKLPGFFMILAASLLLFSACGDKQKIPEAKMVILIGIDGLSIPGLQIAETPNIDELIRTGALSFKTRSVMPSISGPNWASHLMGAGPEQHAVTMNGWTRETTKIDPAQKDEDGYFPSIFSVIREQRPQAKMGFFYDWDALLFFTNPRNIDRIEFSLSYPETFEKVTPWLLENQPEFTFLYVGYPDEVGHEFKWESPEYLRSIEGVDAALGQLFNELKKAGLYEKTHFLVVSDHGAIDYGHGGISMEEMVVPWLISGPGTIQNRMIEQPNDVFNTASTIISLFGLEQPIAWVGRPVYGAFSGSELSKQNTNAYVQDPISNLSSGIYTLPQSLTLKVADAATEIRYTLDGTEPNLNSVLYSEPILLNQNLKLMAAAFRGNYRSRTTKVGFTLVKPVEKIQLRHMPSQKYYSEGAETLINRTFATGEFTDGKWLGFESTDLEATLTLPGISAVSQISIGYLNNTYSWIFPPARVVIQGSTDGKTFFDLGKFEEAQITAQAKAGRNELQLILTEPVSVKFLRVFAANVGVCPPGHSGEGQPAWLFVDEILVQ